MGKSKSSYFSEWFNAVPARWYGMLIILIALVGGTAAAIVWVSDKGLAWYWIGLYVVVVILFIIESYFAYRNVSLERDKIKQERDTLRREIDTKIFDEANIATQIITVSILEEFGYEFQITADSLRLRFSPGIYVSPAVKVEDIKLEIRGERYDTDWKPMKEAVSGYIDKGVYMYVNLPKSFKHGTYQARILACIENKWHPSKPFTLKYQQPPGD